MRNIIIILYFATPTAQPPYAMGSNPGLGCLFRTGIPIRPVSNGWRTGARTNVGTRFVIALEAGKPTIQMGKAIKVLETLGCRILMVPPPNPNPDQP